MLTAFAHWLRRCFRSHSPKPLWRCDFERLEDRLAPAGNLLVTTIGPSGYSLLEEYTQAGTRVWTRPVPQVPNDPLFYAAAGTLAQDATGKVYVYTGSGPAYLASYDPVSDTWTQQTYAEWNHANALGCGGLGVLGQYVYAADMNLSDATGVIRFDVQGNTVTRFPFTFRDVPSLSVGQDGLLYAQTPDYIGVIDPASMTLLRTIELPFNDYRGIAVDASGNLFMLIYSDTVAEFDPTGTLLNSVTLPAGTGPGNTIAVAPDGTVAVGTGPGYVVQMTAALTNATTFDTGSGRSVNVTFATVPLGMGNPIDLSVADASQHEPLPGNSATLNFTVTRSGVLTDPLIISYATVPGTAQPGVDYTATSGTATFAAGSATATISIPIFNNNVLDNPDLASSVQFTGVLSADISLASPVVETAGTDLSDMASGDFNGDGKPDLIVLEKATGHASVFLNTTLKGDAAPTFAALVSFDLGGSTHLGGMTVADFNNDTRPDLAVVDIDSGYLSVRWDETDTLQTSPVFFFPENYPMGQHPRDVISGDVNGDGKPDLIISRGDAAGAVSVMLNTTPQNDIGFSFADPVDFAVGASPTSLALADLNGDGKPDLVAIDSGSNQISVLLNAMTRGATSSSFVPHQDFATPAGLLAIAAGDLNGDGKPDLAVVSPAGVSTFLNITPQGAALVSLAARQDFATATGPTGLVLHDLNGDGRLDLVTANAANSISVLQNATLLGANALSFAVHADTTVGTTAIALAVDDFNLDDKPDLAVANALSDDVSVLLDTTPGAANRITFARTSAVGTIVERPGPVDLAHSAVTLSAPEVTAGGTITVTLQARDAKGHNEISGGLTVQFKLTSTTASGSFSAVTDNGDGTYTATFTGGDAGAGSITATVNGQPLTTAPAIVTVTFLHFADDFSLTDHSPLSSASWQARQGSLTILNGQAVGLLARNVATMLNVTRVNIALQADVTVPLGQQAGLVARVTASGAYYLARINSTAKGVTADLLLFSGGLFMPLASAKVSSATGTLRFEVVGTSLKLFYGSGPGSLSLVTYAFNAALKAAGGMGLYAPLGAGLDNFSMDAVGLTAPAQLPFKEMFNVTPYAQISRDWTELSGNFAVASQSLLGAGAVNVALVNGVTLTNSVSSLNVAVAAGQQAGLLDRANAAASNAYFARIISIGTGFQAQITRVAAGVITVLKSANVSTGTGFLSFQVAGPSLKLFYGPDAGSLSLVAFAFNTALTTGAIGVRSSRLAVLSNFTTAALVLPTSQTLPLHIGFGGSSPAQQLSRDWLERDGNYRLDGIGEAVGMAALNLATVNGLSAAIVDLQMNAVLTAIGQFAGLVARYSGPGEQNMLAAQVAFTAAGKYTITVQRFLGGVPTTVGHTTVTSFGGGLRFVLNGPILRVYLDGSASPVLTAVDSVLLAAGAVGMRTKQGVPASGFSAS